MILIVNSDEEEAAAWRALDVINSLRNREPTTVRPHVHEDSGRIRTKYAKPEYL